MDEGDEFCLSVAAGHKTGNFSLVIVIATWLRVSSRRLVMGRFAIQGRKKR